MASMIHMHYKIICQLYTKGHYGLPEYHWYNYLCHLQLFLNNFIHIFVITQPHSINVTSGTSIQGGIKTAPIATTSQKNAAAVLP